MRDRAYAYLETELAQKPPVNESWWPSYTAWQAFAVKVLVEGGRNQDANITRLYGYRERMPVFALAYLNDALVAKGEGGGVRSTELAPAHRQRDSARSRDRARRGAERSVPPLVLELERALDRDRAATRSSRPDATDSALSRGLVTWLLRAARRVAGATRRRTRWRSRRSSRTTASSSRVTPNFTAVAQLGRDADRVGAVPGTLDRGEGTDMPMSKLLASAPAGTEQPLTFTRTGAGTLFYSARLRYAVDRLFQQGSDQGIPRRARLRAVRRERHPPGVDVLQGR